MRRGRRAGRRRGRLGPRHSPARPGPDRAFGHAGQIRLSLHCDRHLSSGPGPWHHPHMERVRFCGNCGDAYAWDAQECPACTSPAPGDQEPSAQDRMPCPVCGEAILHTAKKCRFCGEWLAEREPASSVTERWPCGHERGKGTTRCWVRDCNGTKAGRRRLKSTRKREIRGTCRACGHVWHFTSGDEIGNHFHNALEHFRAATSMSLFPRPAERKPDMRRCSKCGSRNVSTGGG